MWIVVVGNPMEHLSIYGPFPDERAAEGWAEAEFPEDPWWLKQPIDPDASISPYDGFPSEKPQALYAGRIDAEPNDEVLVTIWKDGDSDVAFRTGLESWGPPQPLERRSTR